MSSELKFAVLIDADNISDRYVRIILDEVSKDGVATYKRIYGDWTGPRLAAWKPALLDNSIVPVQQYSYTTGKNATDSAMIIDAMDILYTGRVDGFCIASSDSDFTRLAARLRESGMQVIGMGESKTPRPFIAACNQFKYLDLLLINARKTEPAQAPEPKAPEAKADREGLRPQRPSRKKAEGGAPGDKPAPQTDLGTIREAIRAMVEEGSGDDGWLFSGELGNRLAKRFPDFDVRNFGFFKLTPFLESLGLFEIRSTPAGGNKQLIFVRTREETVPE